MNIKDAAFRIANTMSDIQSNANALVAAIKQLASSCPEFQKHPMRDSITHFSQVLEGLVNSEIKP